MSGRSTKTGDGDDARAERLARALRENLRRRKAQARARAGSGDSGDAAPEAPEGDREPGPEPGHTGAGRG